MSDFVPPPQTRTKSASIHNVVGAPGDCARVGAASGVKQQLRRTDGFDAQAALLAPRENGAKRAASNEPVERTGRGKHEWRVALLGARNGVVLAAKTTIGERARRDLAAFENFEKTMTFAASESVLSLAIGETFNTLTSALPSPLSAVKSSFELVGDIYTNADAATRGGRLDAWIEAHRDAANEMHERELDAEDARLRWVGQQIDALVDDESEQGERRKQEWELAMTKIAFPVLQTTAQLEYHLYDEWCRQAGAYFSVNLYKTDRQYPGQEEVGTTDQNHPAFGGRQIYGMNIPTQILDRLERHEDDPTTSLHLPVEQRHHEREPGSGRWMGRGLSRFDREEEKQR